MNQGKKKMEFEYSVSGRVGKFALTNPPVNAYGPDGFRKIADALTEIGQTDEIDVLVLYGEGRGYCAGVNTKLLNADPTSVPAMNRAFFDTAAAIHHLPVPVISAVHGHALGAGIAMAGASDIVIAAEGAKFGLPEINVGLLGGASHALRILPLAKVRTMYFTGEPITAEEMYRLGAVESVVPYEEMLPAAEALAAKIASKPSSTLRFAKEAMNGIEPVNLEKNYRYEQGFTFEITHSGATGQGVS